MVPCAGQTAGASAALVQAIRTDGALKLTEGVAVLVETSTISFPCALLASRPLWSLLSAGG